MRGDFAALYQVVFFGCAALLWLLERWSALQRAHVSIERRWTSNLGLLALGSLLSAVLLPSGFVAFAAEQPPGVMSRLGWPFALQAAVTFLVLDIWRYWEHRLFHQVPLLWRLHLVHHSDTQIDVTTSERHHPFEVATSIAWLLVPIIALGLPAMAVGVYVVVAAVVGLCSHANLRFPARLDRRLNRFVVTPALHAVHHSERQAHTDSNYGAVLSVWDRLFGTFVDPARSSVAQHGLHYFHLPKDTGLWGVLRQPLAYRRDLVYPPRSEIDRASPTASRMSPDAKLALACAAVGLALVIAAMGSTAVGMMTTWRNNEAYYYAWLAVPLLVYLTASKHADPQPWHDARPSFAGVGVASIAALIWSAADLMNIDLGQQIAFVLALQGLALAGLGWRAYRRAFPTLALLFLIIPSGDLLQPVLRALTREAIAAFAFVAGLPHAVDGYFVYVGANRYFVAEECAGLATVTLGLFLGYSFALLLRWSFVQAGAFAIAGALLGFAANVLRVNAIVLIDWIRGSQMPLTAHGVLQWIMVIVMLGALMAVLSRARMRRARPAFDTAPKVGAHPLARWAPVMAGLFAILVVMGTASLEAREASPLPAEALPMAPRLVAGWALDDRAPAWQRDSAHDTRSMELSYSREGRALRVVIIAALWREAKLQESRLAPREEGVWRQKELREDSGCVGTQCIALRHAIWQRDKGRELRHVYSAYSIGRLVTDSRLALRAMQGWHRLTGDAVRPRLVAIAGADILNANDAAAMILAIVRP